MFITVLELTDRFNMQENIFTVHISDKCDLVNLHYVNSVTVADQRNFRNLQTVS